MNIPAAGSPERAAATNALAVVGLIALVVAGISLAIYATRFVPAVGNRINAAAVYLGSAFTPAPKSDLSVVTIPGTPVTISFGQATSTVSTTTNATSPKTAGVRKPTTAGGKTSGTFSLTGGPATTGTTATAFGLPDLVVTVSSIGYLSSASADSFVQSATVPSGNRPAIKFTIKNIGTNWTGSWRFSTAIPTPTGFFYQSQPQQSLAPGDSIDYTLGFDQANRGTSQMISITANFDRVVAESNINNNDISATVTVL